MEEYLIERDTLAKMVDALLSQKYPDQPPANFDEIRVNTMHALDDKIAVKIFSSLNDEQLKEVNKLLDDPDTSPEVFTDFFKNAGVDLEQKITDGAKEFAEKFLGGKDE